MSDKSKISPIKPSDNLQCIEPVSVQLNWIVGGLGTAAYAAAFEHPRYYTIAGRAGDWTLSHPKAGALFVMEGLETQIAARRAAQEHFDSVVRAAFAPAPSQPRPQIRVRHKKRGSEYDVIGVGKMQTEQWGYDKQIGPCTFEPRGADMEDVCVYRSIDDGSLWVRPLDEFTDGRFEPVDPALSQQDTPSPQEQVRVPSVAEIMEQVQVFASTYSLVGGRFDDGSKMQQAQDEKAELRQMLEAAVRSEVDR